MVEDVECFHPELECQTFGELECLADIHVKVADARPSDNVAPAVAELAIQRLHEACGVELLRDALVEPAIRVAARHQVGSLNECIDQGINGCHDRVSKSFLEGDYATQ